MRRATRSSVFRGFRSLTTMRACDTDLLTELSLRHVYGTFVEDPVGDYNVAIELRNDDSLSTVTRVVDKHFPLWKLSEDDWLDIMAQRHVRYDPPGKYTTVILHT